MTIGSTALLLALGRYVPPVNALVPRLHSWVGLYQRIFYALMLCWIELAALRLLLLAHGPPGLARSQPVAGPPTLTHEPEALGLGDSAGD